MIVGIGADLCEIERIGGAIQRRGQRFLDRVFTPAEQGLAAGLTEPASFYAARFAAKEACLKALGTGITERVRWTDVEVLTARSGQPIVALTGGALRRVRRLVGKGRYHVVHASISHVGKLACAFVICEARDGT